MDTELQPLHIAALYADFCIFDQNLTEIRERIDKLHFDSPIDWIPAPPLLASLNYLVSNYEALAMHNIARAREILRLVEADLEAQFPQHELWKKITKQRITRLMARRKSSNDSRLNDEILKKHWFVVSGSINLTPRREMDHSISTLEQMLDKMHTETMGFTVKLGPKLIGRRRKLH